MKFSAICIFVLLSCSLNNLAQTKSAIGRLASQNGGTGSGSVCLKIGTKTSCYEWAQGTKFSANFRTRSDAWETGAEWRITYTVKGLFLRRVTFYGAGLSIARHNDHKIAVDNNS